MHSLCQAYDDSIIWNLETYQGQDYIIKGGKVSNTLCEGVVNINRVYYGIVEDYSLNKDTLTIEINESKYQLFSGSSYEVLKVYSQVVYTLTEPEGVRYIKIANENEFSILLSDYYDRSTFEDLTVLNCK